MRRPITAALVAVAVLALGATAIAQSQRFTDVPPEHKAFKAVEWAADVGLTTGYEDGTFRPDEPLPRWAALLFMERYYDDVLGADESDGFTRADMMVLLKAIDDAADTGRSDPAESADEDAVVLAGQGSGTTRKVQLSAGVWDVVYEVAGNADRPFGVTSVGEYTSYTYGNAQRIKTRDPRVSSLWTDDPATFRRTYAVGGEASYAPSVYRLSEETVFEVDAEPDAVWSITLVPRPLPAEPVVEPGRIVLSSAGGEGPYGPFEFAEGGWDWEFAVWDTASGVTVRLVAEGPDNVTLMGHDTTVADLGRNIGGFYLGPTDHPWYRPRAGRKFVVVDLPQGVGWLLTLTRDG